jgi:hypothetical protein
MHAVAKMVRVLKDGTERPVEQMPLQPTIKAVLNPEDQEAIRIKLWHGTCLEAEAEIKFINDQVVVNLIPKKELRKDAPKEATC